MSDFWPLRVAITCTDKFGSMAFALAALGLVINAFCYGTLWWPFRQLSALGLHPLWSTMLLDALAIAIIVLLYPRVWRDFIKFPLLWALVLAAGLTNVGFNWAVVEGDVVRVTLLFYLMPAWVVVLAWPILGERPNKGSLLRLGLALLGVVVVLKTPQAQWPFPESLADYLALLGGFSFALTNVMLRRLQGTPAVASAMAMFLGGGLLCGITAAIGNHVGIVSDLPAVDVRWAWGVVGLTITVLLANIALQYGASRLPANTTSVIMLLEIVFASISSVLLGAGQLTPNALLGGALIFVASAWSALAAKQSH